MSSVVLNYHLNKFDYAEEGGRIIFNCKYPKGPEVFDFQHKRIDGKFSDWESFNKSNNSVLFVPPKGSIYKCSSSQLMFIEKKDQHVRDHYVLAVYEDSRIEKLSLKAAEAIWVKFDSQDESSNRFWILLILPVIAFPAFMILRINREFKKSRDLTKSPEFGNSKKPDSI